MKRCGKDAEFATLNRQWTEEVGAVVASEGLPWQVRTCWCEQRSGARCAEFVHRANGKSRYVSISGEHVVTAPGRRAEIIRQLQR